MNDSRSQTDTPKASSSQSINYGCFFLQTKRNMNLTISMPSHCSRIIRQVNPIPGDLRSHSKIHYPFLHSFLHLNLRCKQELVASACGVDTGLFAIHVSKLLMIQRLRKSKCFLSKHHSFDREYHNRTSDDNNCVAHIKECQRIEEMYLKRAHVCGHNIHNIIHRRNMRQI